MQVESLVFVRNKRLPQNLNLTCMPLFWIFPVINNAHSQNPSCTLRFPSQPSIKIQCLIPILNRLDC